jgi:hypothetical protein
MPNDITLHNGGHVQIAEHFTYPGLHFGTGRCDNRRDWHCSRANAASWDRGDDTQPRSTTIAAKT